jgi:hypothetical protein
LNGGEASLTMSGDAALTTSMRKCPPTFHPCVGDETFPSTSGLHT